MAMCETVAGTPIEIFVDICCTEPDIVPSKKRKRGADHESGTPRSEQRPANFLSDVTDIVPHYCPQAVIDWAEIGSDRSRKFENSRDMTLRAKQHLVAAGWNLWIIRKQKDRTELRYTSPKGKHYISLVRACEAFIEDDKHGKSVQRKSTKRRVVEKQVERGGKHIGGCKAGVHEGSLLGLISIDRRVEEKQAERSGDKGAEGKKAERNGKQNRCCKSGVQEASVSGRRSTKERGRGKQLNIPLAAEKSCLQAKKLNDGSRARASRSYKKAREELGLPSPIQYSPRTVLSYLIDKEVILPREKVSYIHTKKGRKMAEGRITRKGIKCNCCLKVFTLTKFEAHAGSTLHHPSANIFLEDGRSLMQCQLEMALKSKLTCSKREAHKGIKKNQHRDKSDGECSVCHDGGTLVLCDHCPSAFHLSCLGLEVLPEGEWYCPCCRCGICQQSDYNKDTEQFTESTVLYCDQCEREYHVGCIREKRGVKLESLPKQSWFCSEKCEQISLGLRKMLGKHFSVGIDNLTWSILQSSKINSNSPDGETTIEHHTKLNIALGVMHECFYPIQDPYSERDVLEDILFNRRSDLNRLDFSGFYTVFLERGDDVISVATVRIHGEKVAEMPFVATRFPYRRQGMCRILMDVLEKKLTELGVERLTLPAISQMLHTWTTSFGFTKTPQSDRLKFLDYTFLDFQGTAMCHKFLRVPTETAEPIGHDQYSPQGSEVIQTQKIELCGRESQW